MQSRTASFFNKLAKTSSDALWLAKLSQNDLEHAKNLMENKADLDRVYSLIEHSARGGGIRTFLNYEDPILKNDVVIKELRIQGFAINMGYHNQVAIEWWHIPKEKELE
jgi:hypothetical protein